MVRCPFVGNLFVHSRDVEQQPQRNILAYTGLMLNQDDQLAVHRERNVVHQVHEEDVLERVYFYFCAFAVIASRKGAVQFEQLVFVVKKRREDRVFVFAVRANNVLIFCAVVANIVNQNDMLSKAFPNCIGIQANSLMAFKRGCTTPPG